MRRPPLLAPGRLLGLILITIAASASPRAADTRQNGGWVLAHDAPFAGKYEDFAFPDTRHGWLANAAGDILHTADGGATWSLQARGLGRLRSVDFLDERRGFAGTINGVLHATSDGGATWKDITSTLPKATLGFCGMTHVGEHTHIVGKYTGGAADYFFSPDGGHTWRVTDLSQHAYGLVDVSFVSDAVGFIGGQAKGQSPGVGPAMILKTIDGGRSWRPVFTHDGGRGFAWKIFPVSSTLIYAGLQSQDGTYRIAKSTDAGDHWVVKNVATDRPQGPGIQGIGFLDARTGWVGGFFAGMYATADGGETWTPIAQEDRTINRFEKVGGSMFTASVRGVLRYDPPASKR